MPIACGRRSSPLLLFGVVLVLAVNVGGCRRRDYREAADREVYALLDESSAGTPWKLAEGFRIEPVPSSRLFDPGDPDRPMLPSPGPELYTYELPVDELEAVATDPQEAASKRETRKGPASSAPEDGTKPRPRGKAELDASTGKLRVQPVPSPYWESVPRACLSRMLEFESVQGEYRLQFSEEPPADWLEAARRLTFKDVLHLALLNSREYQSQKESLYLAALALTRERYDHKLKFSAEGNGADAEFAQTRIDGRTEEQGIIASGIQGDEVLATGGTLLARFANDVVLTFDGPEGFATSVGSELFFNLNETLFQRDIRLEGLVQAERDLVYAGRVFARFRKEFFVGIASDYYDILRTYRSIEIESQNYFSLVRTYEQAKEEARAGVENAPNPVAVDQFEQGMLSGRSSLISTCNDLEQSLDLLKLTLGLPTELPINIDLAELERLTWRDSVEVAAERVRRWRSLLLDRVRRPKPDQSDILNGKIFLIERLLDWLQLRRGIEADVPESEALELRLLRDRVTAAHVAEQRIRSELNRARDPSAGSPLTLICGRTDDLVDALLQLCRRQLALVEWEKGDSEATASKASQLAGLGERLENQRERLSTVVQESLEELQELLTAIEQLSFTLEGVTVELDRLLGVQARSVSPEDDLRRSREDANDLTALAKSLLEDAGPGLSIVNISADDAMATALVQRLDLMNTRGALADRWRSIKLAADDLKSVLTLNVSQSIGTPENKPFKFSLDESQSRLGIQFDLPLDRHEQRNDYRRSLISYQASLRSLMELEDSIKFDARNRLRFLAETRIQYPISVTQAALAAEQVLSVRFQLALGVQGVRGTDLLDALQSSREALISVANARIGYIVQQAEFVLDLGLIELDNQGSWGALGDPDYQPEPNFVYPEGAGPTYGDLPRAVFLSKEIRSLLEYPLPGQGDSSAGAGQ